MANIKFAGRSPKIKYPPLLKRYNIRLTQLELDSFAKNKKPIHLQPIRKAHPQRILRYCCRRSYHHSQMKHPSQMKYRSMQIVLSYPSQHPLPHLLGLLAFCLSAFSLALNYKFHFNSCQLLKY